MPLDVLDEPWLDELGTGPWLEEAEGFPEDIEASLLDVLTDIVGRPVKLELDPLEELTKGWLEELDPMEWLEVVPCWLEEEETLPLDVLDDTGP